MLPLKKSLGYYNNLVFKNGIFLQKHYLKLKTKILIQLFKPVPDKVVLTKRFLSNTRFFYKSQLFIAEKTRVYNFHN